METIRRSFPWKPCLYWSIGILFALTLSLALFRLEVAGFFLGRASHAAANGDLPTAISYANVAVLLAPSREKNLVISLRASYRGAARDYEAAIADYDWMLNRDPDWRNGDGYLARAMCYLGWEKWDLAIRDFSAAQKYSGRETFIHYELGRAFEGKGDKDAARRHYQEPASSKDNAVFSKEAQKALEKLQ